MSDDEFTNHCRRESALAIGDWLVGANALQRPIKTLQLHELEAMAEAATSRLIVLVSKRRAEYVKLPSKLETLFWSG
jgi:hypothetical protein